MLKDKTKKYFISLIYRFMICLLIFGIAVLCKKAFPASKKNVYKYVSENIDIYETSSAIKKLCSEILPF